MHETFGENSTETIYGEPTEKPTTVWTTNEPGSRPYIDGCANCSLFGIVTRMGDSVFRICPQHWAGLFYNQLLRVRGKTGHA